MYPAFGFPAAPGIVKTILPNYPSDIGKNTYKNRNISVYLPVTVTQNTVRRKMNVLVVNDGSINEVTSYVSSGFEVAQYNGHVPESIIIGIPQKGADCNRQYEMLFEACDSIDKWKKYDRTSLSKPPSNSYYYGCPGSTDSSGSSKACPPELQGGGADLYLEWIYKDVVKAVLDILKVLLTQQLTYTEHSQAVPIHSIKCSTYRQ